METHKKRRRHIRNLDVEKQKRHRRMLSEEVGKAGMWPLNAPGMPPPGPDFLRHAENMGDDTLYTKATKAAEMVLEPGQKLNELYRRALREPGFTMPIETKKGFPPETVTFVPGHIWGQYAYEYEKSLTDVHYTPPAVDGPQPAEVMVIGKMPGKTELKEMRNLLGDSGKIFTDVINKTHVSGARKWYVTNLVKFGVPEGATIKAAWIQDCLPLLHQELRIVRPKFILCLGADATKALLGPQYSVDNMMGRVVPYTYRVNYNHEDEPEHHTAHVMTVIHPAAVARTPELIRTLEANFGRFAHVLETGSLEQEEKDLDHRVCYVLEDAEEWCAEAEYECDNLKPAERLIGIDLEWHGHHPVNEGTYVRTIQFSWAHKKAITFVISHPGGKTAFRDRNGKPAIKRLIKLLNTFLKGKRPVGHFLVSDMEWAESLGLDLKGANPVPLYDKHYVKDGKKRRKRAWELMRDGQGWLDTAMMLHAIEETAKLGLEYLTLRHTSAPPYYTKLEEEIQRYCKINKIKREALEGYGNVPDKILVPYANYDADVTRRIAVTLLPLLDYDYQGNCCWEAFWESIIIQKPILKIHQNGMRVKRKRIDYLTNAFIQWRSVLEDHIREWACWPDFNIRSTQHVREFLFGEKLNGKRTEDGKTVRIRPEAGKALYIEPLLDTSKPPRRWKDLKERGLDRDATPGTGKMILGILAQDNLNVVSQINWIRDYRFMDQVLKSVLRPPAVDENDHLIEDDDGNLVYEAGLASCIDDDGRVRTHLYPTAETGRWKSARPNLQNISKSRDPDYVRLLGGQKNDKGKWIGGDYKYTLRSILCGTPGYAMIEFDYTGAELYLMAIMSGSKKMQDHCVRALLPDEGFNARGKPEPGGKFPHPDYYDIHSNVAVLAFQLNCAPTKNGLAEIGKAHFRTLAKNVIFGIAYGRQAKAIALQAREQGIKVTPDDAQRVIDAIFEMYSELQPFFESAKMRALDERWLCSCFGRFRRFPQTDDYKLEGEFERQAMNFTIQSGVASCVDRGLAYLDDEIDRQGLTNDIRLLLQIHDAGIVECKYELVPYTIDLIKWAMVDMVEIWPSTLDGVPTGEGPFRLGLDFGVYKNWSEPYTKAQCKELGIPEKYGKG